MITISLSFTEQQIRSALRNAQFPSGRVRCVHCRCYRVRRIEKRYHCRRCRKKFSLVSATWLSGSKLPLKVVALLLYCWACGYTISRTQELASVSVPTVRRYFRLFRLNVVKTTDFKPKQRVQADEAYFGRFKRQANIYHTQQRYRLAPKTGVVGVGDPDTKQLATTILGPKPGKAIAAFIRQHVPRTVHVYSDGSPFYTHLRDTHNHLAQTHDISFEYAYFIESCWSWMKRKLFTQYHHFTKPYAAEYIAELTWRFNTRETPKNPLTLLQNSLTHVP